VRLTRTAYTCPILMNLTVALLRFSRHPARWKKDCGGVWHVIRRIPGREHGYEARCPFPRRLIHLEWRFWESRPGLRLRSLVERRRIVS
jgi:hypothetical protein